jgi:isopenicillin-N N-acyltransferase-like protein
MQVVRARGTPYERGAVIGEAFADAMTSSLAFNRRYLTGHGVSGDALERLLDPYLAAANAALPHLVSQIRGMADGAGMPFLDVFAANAFEEVYGVIELGTPSPVPLERCTDVVLRSSQSTLLGHNEQWYAGDDGAVGLVLDVSDDAPSVLAPVVAGTLPLVGLNELGGAFGTMSLTAGDEHIGIPRALVAREILEASSCQDAFTRASRDGRAGGYSYLCAFPGGASCVIETTATTAARLGVTVHTNHALDPAVATASCQPSAGSRSRLTRARALVAAAQPSVEGMADLLADHEAEGQDICVHPYPALGDEGSTILFAMICEPDTRSMWLTPGHPCTTPFERFGFDDSARPALHRDRSTKGQP